MAFNNLDLTLIRLVKSCPVLYDSNDPKYMDQNTREVTWQRIGDEMKRPASECKARWINIRDINRRIIRKVLQNPGSNTRMYKYFHELAFMRPFYKDLMIQNADFGVFDDVTKNCKVEQEDNDDDGDDDDVPIANETSDDSDDNKPIMKRSPKKNSKKPPSMLKKRKVLEDVEYITDVPGPSNHDTSNNQTELDPTDKVDAFLLSIGATLKTFTPYHLNMAKTKIFAVVQEHELQQIVTKQGGSVDSLE